MANDNSRATSDYLNRPVRPLATALWEQGRDQGRTALATWGRSVYLNLVAPTDDGPIMIETYGLVSGAALAAWDARTEGYRLTLAVYPEGVSEMDLRALGEHLAAHLPHIEPGNA